MFSMTRMKMADRSRQDTLSWRM